MHSINSRGFASFAGCPAGSGRPTCLVVPATDNHDHHHNSRNPNHTGDPFGWRAQRGATATTAWHHAVTGSTVGKIPKCSSQCRRSSISKITHSLYMLTLFWYNIPLICYICATVINKRPLKMVYGAYRRWKPVAREKIIYK